MGPIIWCKSSPQFDLPFIPTETHWLDHPSRYISSLQPIYSNVGRCFRCFWSMFSSWSYKGTNKRYKTKATLRWVSPIVWCKSSPSLIPTETHWLNRASINIYFPLNLCSLNTARLVDVQKIFFTARLNAIEPGNLCRLIPALAIRAWVFRLLPSHSLPYTEGLYRRKTWVHWFRTTE